MNFWLTMRPGGPKTDFCRILRQKSMPQRPPLWYNNRQGRLLYYFCATARRSGWRQPGNRLLMRNYTIPLRFMV